ncbi:MAG: DUF4199 domain-containing protein [Bacteroidetes bacterium]|nr:DUF4199 domain-containing protein [Bacteroidota bacterium]
MYLKIIVRYSVLLSLLMLLWLSLEYMVGLHDRFIAYQPYVTLLAVGISIFCIHRALIEVQKEALHRLTFRQAFVIGFIITLISAVLAIPVQIIFHQLINPDFFQNMKEYSVKHAIELNEDVERAKLQAESYFNLTSYLLQSVLGTLVSGTVISLVLAWWKSRKRR